MLWDMIIALFEQVPNAYEAHSTMTNRIMALQKRLGDENRILNVSAAS